MLSVHETARNLYFKLWLKKVLQLLCTTYTHKRWYIHITEPVSIKHCSLTQNLAPHKRVLTVYLKNNLVVYKLYIVPYMPNNSVSTTDIPQISAMLNINHMTESNELKMAVHKNKVQTFPCTDWEKQTHWEEWCIISWDLNLNHLKACALAIKLTRYGQGRV